MSGYSKPAIARAAGLVRRRAAVIVCVIAALLIFAVPLGIPVAQQSTTSASYVVGFSNRAAVLATALLAGIVLLVWWWKPQGRELPTEPAAPTETIGPALLCAVLTATVAWLIAAWWLLTASNLRYLADAGYFIEQASAHAETGRRLYSDLEFAYGPLLFYPTVWVHVLLPGSWTSAYFVVLGTACCLGIAMLAWWMNQLPMTGCARRWGFALLSLGALNPLLGMNYTFFRCITPFVVMWIASGVESVWYCALMLSGGELLLLAISPELGLAFLAAVVAFAVLKCFLVSKTWLAVFIAPAATAWLALLLAGPAWLQMVRAFSAGSLNLPVGPYPHVLIFLFAVVWLVPTFLGKELRAKSRGSVQMTACYILGLALLPAALGRCDPLHVFFNGAGILVLALAAQKNGSRKQQIVWMALLVLFVGWQQVVNYRLQGDRTLDTVRLAVMPRLKPATQEQLLRLLHSPEALMP